MDKKWWKESVVYQIYPRSFMDSNGDGIGDLNGITQKLDYLKDLGIDVIWISPIYQSPNADNGYDISDYCAIQPEFGTMEDFDNLLCEAHARGIRILMDLVVNHTSDEHPWFIESRCGVDNSYRDYYIWRPALDGSYPNNWGSCFSGPAWTYDETTEMYYLHLFSKKQPDLNWDNPKVRSEVFDMMTWWLEKGIDGFRMDVISLISKQEGLPDGPLASDGYAVRNVSANGPHVHEYLREMREQVLGHYNIMSVGECMGVTLDEAKKYASSDEKELNMVFQFEHMYVDEDPSGDKWDKLPFDLVRFKQILTDWQKGLQDISWNSLFIENHDFPRIVSRFGDAGQYRETSAKMFATCYMMMQGTPYIYQGQELGMTNGAFSGIEDFRDIESINAFRDLTGKGIYSEEEMIERLRNKSRDNARTPMQWDDSPNAGFSTVSPWIGVNPNYKEVNAKEEIRREDSVYHYYQKLIQLRKEYEILIYGDYDLLMPDDPDLYVYTRTLGEEKVLVVCNFSDGTHSFALPTEFAGALLLVGNYPEQTLQAKMQLRPYEALLLMN